MADRTSLLADQVAPQKKKKETEFTQILRVFNVLLALAIVGFSIYCYVGFRDSENVPSFLNDPSMTVLPAYVGLAGLIILAVEFNIRLIVRNMKFLHHYFGRGIFNIYVGILCFAMVIGITRRSDKEPVTPTRLSCMWPEGWLRCSG